MGNRASVVGGFLGRNQSTQGPCCHVKDSDEPVTYRRCCKPYKLLRLGSIPTHCSGVHDKPKSDLDIVMCDEEGNAIPV